MGSIKNKKSNNEKAKNSLAMIELGESLPLEVQPLQAHPPIISSYNSCIRPLLDAVDKLRRLNIAQEGIQLPTIVVVGDQSSGKSSVLESLAGISLPRGQGICTRVPLIMRLQNHPTPEPELFLEYKDQRVHTDETHIAEAINSATDEIAGTGKGISNAPLTLVVKKSGVPDLTMVDLPGITRVPVHGQPEDIYEQVSATIMEYIIPEESIILNVLSATVDFSTCESIRMSQRVDKNGVRTLAVVTKADRAPEGLLEKVTADDVKIGLGYVCVRNRIGDESYGEARMEEARLFETHPLLSKIDKSIVGVPILAQKLVQIQATIIARCVPEMVKKINEKLSLNVAELDKMPKHMSSAAEAMTTFMRIIGSSKESLRKILLRGEFDEYPEDVNMHCTARLAQMLDQFSDQLQKSSVEGDSAHEFLMEEIKVLEEARVVGLPNFLPRVAFLTLLQSKVKKISSLPMEFVNRVWDYIGDVVISILMHHSENYPQLQSSTRRAGHNTIEKMKSQSVAFVKQVVDMEKMTDYTCHPGYVSMWQEHMKKEEWFLKEVFEKTNTVELCLDGFGIVKVNHLRKDPGLTKQAFDMKMRMTTYWRVVLRRLVDSMAMHLNFSVQNLVNKEMDMAFVGELLAGQGTLDNGIEKMLEESPSVAGKRSKLKKSIALLKESRDILGNIVERIATYSD